MMPRLANPLKALRGGRCCEIPLNTYSDRSDEGEGEARLGI